MPPEGPEHRNGPSRGHAATAAERHPDTLVQVLLDEGNLNMGNGFLDLIRRRGNQRWLKREANLLASEAEAFDCPEMRREARRLLEVTSGIGSLWVLRTA